MLQIFTDTGLVELLNRLVTPSLVWHLFANNVVPTVSTVIGGPGGLSEAAFSGYAAVTKFATAFTIGDVVNHNGTLIAPPAEFFNTGSDTTVYGYYITNAGGTLIAAAYFDEAPLTILGGDNFFVACLLSDFSKFT